MGDFLERFFTGLIANQFTGSIEIHFFKGGVGKIVKHESVK